MQHGTPALQNQHVEQAADSCWTQHAELAEQRVCGGPYCSWPGWQLLALAVENSKQACSAISAKFADSSASYECRECLIQASLQPIRLAAMAPEGSRHPCSTHSHLRC